MPYCRAKFVIFWRPGFFQTNSTLGTARAALQDLLWKKCHNPPINYTTFYRHQKLAILIYAHPAICPPHAPALNATRSHFYLTHFATSRTSILVSHNFVLAFIIILYVSVLWLTITFLNHYRCLWYLFLLLSWWHVLYCMLFNLFGCNLWNKLLRMKKPSFCGRAEMHQLFCVDFVQANRFPGLEWWYSLI